VLLYGSVLITIAEAEALPNMGQAGPRNAIVREGLLRVSREGEQGFLKVHSKTERIKEKCLAQKVSQGRERSPQKKKKNAENVTTFTPFA